MRPLDLRSAVGVANIMSGPCLAQTELGRTHGLHHRGQIAQHDACPGCPRETTLHLRFRFAMTTDDFEITISLVPHALARVSGDLDQRDSRELSGILRSLIENGHTVVHVDVRALTFIGAAGLWAITDASNRLSAVSGELRVRFASPQVRRLFGIVGIAALIDDNTLDRLAAAPATNQRTGNHSKATVSRRAADGLATAGYGAVIASTAVIDASLRLVTALAVETVTGADGASVSLARNGQLRTVAASNDTVFEMDLHQYETGQGPCISAAAEGHGFHIESLADEPRWPKFVPQALELGIASIFSTPLLLADRAVGALNMYSNTSRAFGPPQQKLAASLASQASSILTDSGAEISAEQTSQRIANALVDRQVIAQAQGVLMATRGLGAEAAASVLYRLARTAGLPVAQQAAAIVANLDPTDQPRHSDE